jgi:hypothetical protein
LGRGWGGPGEGLDGKKWRIGNPAFIYIRNFPVILSADACAARMVIYGEMQAPAAQVHGAILGAFKPYGQWRRRF